MDTVKNAVASAVFAVLNKANSKRELVSWPCEIQNTGRLQVLVSVRPVDGQPRRSFVVQIKEMM